MIHFWRFLAFYLKKQKVNSLILMCYLINSLKWVITMEILEYIMIWLLLCSINIQIFLLKINYLCYWTWFQIVWISTMSEINNVTFLIIYWYFTQLFWRKVRSWTNINCIKLQVCINIWTHLKTRMKLAKKSLKIRSV